MIYGGYIYDQVTRFSGPSRDLNDKNRISYEEYPKDNFPVYAGGPLYFLSRDIALDIFVTRKHIYSEKENPLFKFEDVYLGYLISRLSGVNYIHIQNLLPIGVPEGVEYNGAISVMGVKDARRIRNFI